MSFGQCFPIQVSRKNRKNRFVLSSNESNGALFQLPPGEYLSTYRDCHPEWGSCDPGGDGWYESNVLVRVLPHDVAHELGPAEDRGLGSVKCPEE